MYQYVQLVYIRICISVTWDQARLVAFLHCMPMGKYLNASCFVWTSQDHPILSVLWKIISSVMILVPLIDRNRITGKGYLRSYDIISCFFINHDTMVLNTCKGYQTPHLVKARRLVCSMTIPHLIGEWPGLDLGSNFTLTCGCHRIPISHRLDESSKKCINFMPLCFLVQKLYK